MITKLDKQFLKEELYNLDDLYEMLNDGLLQIELDKKFNSFSVEFPRLFKTHRKDPIWGKGEFLSQNIEIEY
jgi:hypothetical protein